jgi:sulfate/thiosulfate transport system permease protein
LATRAEGVESGARWTTRFAGLELGRLGLRVVAVFYLGLAVVLPVVAVLSHGFGDGIQSLRAALSSPGAAAAIKLTLIASAGAALLNAVFGTLIAYVLVRFRFPGRSLFSAIVDLPFAIPTLVTGVMLVALYGPASPVGGWLESHGVHVVFAPLGILFALTFVTLPFVVRSVQPVLLELDPAEEEAARVLGAGGWTTFRKVVFPALRAAIVGGALLSFARAIGEFGAVVIISGNLTGRTLTAPVYIFQLTSQFKTAEAAAVASLLFGMSFLLVIVTDRLIRKGLPR